MELPPSLFIFWQEGRKALSGLVERDASHGGRKETLFCQLP